MKFAMGKSRLVKLDEMHKAIRALGTQGFRIRDVFHNQAEFMPLMEINFLGGE